MSDGGREGTLRGLVWEQSTDGIVVVDTALRVKLFNPAAARMVGFRAASGETLTEAQHVILGGIYLPDRETPYPATELAFQRALGGEVVLDQLLYVRNAVVPGSYLAVCATPLRDDGGQIVGAVATIRDVTAYVEREAFCREMTGLLAHDLKNVMAVVIMNLAVARRAAREDEVLADADAAARRAVRLATNLLDVTRLEEGRLVPRIVTADLAAVVRNVAATRRVQAGEKGITFDVEGEASLLAPIDAELVGRVVENILDNAFRFTPNAGRIHVAVERDGPHVELRFGNTGPAVAPEARETIFRKNVQAAQVAANTYGLGLYFARLVVEAHRGRIRVEATKTFPTLFVVELPAS